MASKVCACSFTTSVRTCTLFLTQNTSLLLLNELYFWLMVLLADETRASVDWNMVRKDSFLSSSWDDTIRVIHHSFLWSSRWWISHLSESRASLSFQKKMVVSKQGKSRNLAYMCGITYSGCINMPYLSSLKQWLLWVCIGCDAILNLWYGAECASA
jgi:hypothetical protein